MKIGVLLSGNGVFDGSEIHEAVLTLLAIDENDAEAVCYAPDIEQHHVINHITGKEMDEKRNVLIESARIARGKIKQLSEFNADDIDALVIPGGFGAAKNLTKWAFSGPDGEILEDVKKAINEIIISNKPLAGLCMGPTVIARALQGSGIKTELTIGTTEENSPYDIKAISEGIEKTGANAVMKSISEIAVDEKNKIVTAPCYMMQASITEVRKNIQTAINQLVEMM
jgi:enhancing lycopene biosynthesis protein 2